MNNTHYIQIVKDSQHYNKVNQIKGALDRLYHKMYKNEEEFFYSLTTAQEDFEYILKAVENTDKLYKLIKRKT